MGTKEIDTGFHVTNPDPWLLQRFLRSVVNKNYKYVVLEVTSHGLHQYRTLGTNIKIAVLTNVTHEHLDYHKTYENYLNTKAKIFRGAKLAVINRSDQSYRFIRKFIDEGTETVAYNLEATPPKVKLAIRGRFPETYNQLNATAAYIAARGFGVKDGIVINSIKSFPGVPGRMEEVKNSRGFRIIIDFAHTPNALKSVLTELQKLLKKGNKLISVFGCASERDELKRPVMGEISTKLADISIFTAEDPRFESIEKIISDIKIGVKKNIKPNKFYEIPDRAEAIDFAINKVAKKGDIVVICGKGHEKSMNYNGIEYPWSDHKAVEFALEGKALEIKRP